MKQLARVWLLDLMTYCVTVSTFACGAVVVMLLWSCGARASDVDVVVVAHGGASEQPALAAVRASVAARFRDLGQKQLANVAVTFEQRHSRMALVPDAAHLAVWMEELSRARARSQLDRVALLASQIAAELARVPEVLIDRKQATAACYEGTLAYERLGRLDDATPLIEFCQGLAWLVTPDVMPAARHILKRGLEPHRLTLRVVPQSRALWLQGSPVDAGVYDIQVRSGAQLVVTADCAAPRRVHSVHADPSAGELTVDIDCAFDEAVHTEASSLRLSSGAEVVIDHARHVGEALGATSVVLVGKGSAGYELRRVIVSSGQVVATPLAIQHQDSDLARAVDVLLERHPRSPDRPPGPPASDRGVRRPALLWSGVAVTAVGLAAQLAGWALYAERVRDGANIVDGGFSTVERAAAWKDARGPMLGVGVAGAGAASVGVALMASAARRERFPWWVAAGAGAAGAGLMVWGAVDLSKGSSCDVVYAATCNAAEARQDRGILLLSSSAPLLTLLAAKGVREAIRDQSSLSVALFGAGARLTGRW
jgi:hypothetical protein